MNYHKIIIKHFFVRYRLVLMSISNNIFRYLKVLHQFCFLNFPLFYHMQHCSVYYYHVTYVFWSESKPYNCLSVKKLLARNSRNILSLSDCNGIRTHDHLVCKQTIRHLTKLTSLIKSLSRCLRNKWF